MGGRAPRRYSTQSSSTRFTSASNPCSVPVTSLPPVNLTRTGCSILWQSARGCGSAGLRRGALRGEGRRGAPLLDVEHGILLAPALRRHLAAERSGASSSWEQLKRRWIDLLGARAPGSGARERRHGPVAKASCTSYEKLSLKTPPALVPAAPQRHCSHRCQQRARKLENGRHGPDMATWLRGRNSGLLRRCACAATAVSGPRVAPPAAMTTP